jgi:hypothetical protein
MLEFFEGDGLVAAGFSLLVAATKEMWAFQSQGTPTVVLR